MKGGLFGAIQKFSNRSLIVPKKTMKKIANGGSVVCFRGSGRRFSVFCFGRGSDDSSVLNLRCKKI